jgi:hypothetical protein
MLLGKRLLLAFDASGVSAVAVARSAGPEGLGERLGVELPPGALAPSVTDDNLARPAEVAAALSALRARLGGEGRRTTLVLPDGVARFLLVETPPRVAPLEFARFRLAQSLPFAAAEAVIDGLPVGPGRVLAAGLRRRGVQGYGRAAAAAGFAVERVELSPLAAVGRVLRSSSAAAGAVAVVLGDVAYSLALLRGGALEAFRNRRRDPGAGEAERLADEADRTAVLAGLGQADRLLVVGPGTRGLLAALRSSGRDAAPAWGGDSESADDAERAFLGAAA